MNKISEVLTVTYDSKDKDISCLVVARREYDKFTHTVISEFYGAEADKLYHELLNDERSGEEWLDNFIKKYNESRDFQITDIRDREKLLDELRPHGEWIRIVDGVGFISHICSECGAEIEIEDCSDDKFCFNCGADMRKGEDNGSISNI